MEEETDQTRKQAEQAAWWLMRLELATPRERVEFMSWLKESPEHVREILLQLKLEESLQRMREQLRIQVGEILATASGRVVPTRFDLFRPVRRAWQARLAAGRRPANEDEFDPETLRP